MAVTLHQLLKTLVEQGGTDLHITTNSPPQIRVDGKLVPLQLPPLTAPETKALAQAHILELTGEGPTRTATLSPTPSQTPPPTQTATPTP